MLVVNSLSKSLPDGRLLLRDINFRVENGEFVAILGLSGIGKTILLRCINGLTMPDSGEVVLQIEDNSNYVICKDSAKIREIRRHIGMIFQNFNLVKRRTVIENVLIGKLGHISTIQSLFEKYSNEDFEKACYALKRVGISDLAHRRAGTLSGGEQQRVAIARTIMQDPYIVLADEPVANLDPATTRIVMGLLLSINIEDGVSMLTVLHQPELARKYATRVIGLRDGMVVYDGDADLSDEALETIYGNESDISKE